MKEDFLSGIKWNYKTSKKGALRNYDVCVSILKKDKNREEVSIAFRDDAVKKITSADHMAAGIDKNRIFFIECTPDKGYKLSRNKASGNVYLRFTVNREDLETYSSFEGCYDLKQFGSFNYIEKADD